MMRFYLLTLLVVCGCSGAVSSRDRQLIEKWLKSPETKGGVDFETGGGTPIEDRDSLESISLLTSTANTRTFAVKWYGTSQPWMLFNMPRSAKRIYVSVVAVHDGDDAVSWQPAVPDGG
jgi:hypothetical protein